MMALEPRLVCTTGMAGAGKSTLCKELTRKISNSLYLDRDQILFAILNINPTKTNELPSFEEYVCKDNVFPENAKEVDTVFGKMIRVSPKNAYHQRHSKNQSYLVMERVARDNLELGKVVIIDSFLTNHINDGTLKKFLDSFKDYHRGLIHFIADKDELFERHIQRPVTYEEEGAILRKDLSTSKEKFMETLDKSYPSHPTRLSEINHLLINTSSRSINDCSKECFSYITNL